MFKVGDKVRCVKPAIGTGQLTKGKTYILSDVDERHAQLRTGDHHMVSIKEADRGRGLQGIYHWRFEPCKLSNKERVKQRMEELHDTR